MNILTFDIEEWYIEKIFKGGRYRKYKQYDEMLDWILLSLDKYQLKATFFCVGELVLHFPDIIRRISDLGHEIGSHGNCHQWINKMTCKEFAKDTQQSVSLLEDLTGKKVKSFRAPAFSIGRDNSWAFEILAESGIEYDCSIFPTNRDFGGFPQFKSSIPSIIECNGVELKELPICPQIVMGKSIPFSGGGYFRLFPLFLQRLWLHNMDYVMFYFHINDLIEEKSGFMSRIEYENYFKEVGTLKNRISRYLKTNIGKGGALRKLDFVLSKYSFLNVEQAIQLIDWSKQPKVKI